MSQEVRTIFLYLCNHVFNFARVAHFSFLSDSVDRELDGRVIHVTGRLQPTTTLNDDAFGVSLPAIRLKRKVEVFQWHEKQTSHSEKNVGGGTTTHKHYEYETKWAEELIDSSKFKMRTAFSLSRCILFLFVAFSFFFQLTCLSCLAHEHQNPKARLVEPSESTSNCIFGANYSIPDSAISNLSNYKLLTLNDGIHERLRQDLRGRFRLYHNSLYSGDPAFPRIGDVRISFHRIDPELFSVIGRQEGTHIVSFRSRQDDDLFLIREGQHTASDLIKQEEGGNKVLLYILRIVSWLMIFLAVCLMLDPIATLFDVLPFLGGIIRLGSGTFAFVVATVLSLFLIGLVWIAHNLSFGLVLFGLGAIALLSSALSGSGKQ